jgi:hypothetical protein
LHRGGGARPAPPRAASSELYRVRTSGLCRSSRARRLLWRPTLCGPRWSRREVGDSTLLSRTGTCQEVCFSSKRSTAGRPIRASGHAPAGSGGSGRGRPASAA